LFFNNITIPKAPRLSLESCRSGLFSYISRVSEKPSLTVRASQVSLRFVSCGINMRNLPAGGKAAPAEAEPMPRCAPAPTSKPTIEPRHLSSKFCLFSLLSGTEMAPPGICAGGKARFYDFRRGWRRVKRCGVGINAHRLPGSQSVAWRRPACPLFRRPSLESRLTLHKGMGDTVHTDAH